MKKWTLVFISFTFFTLFNTAWADSNTAATKQVIEQWFAAMKDKNLEQAASYLAPQFVSIHTDGIVRNKTQELTLIKNLQMKSYHLSDFQYSQSNNVITVTYKDDGIEKIDNQPITTKPAGRMAVLQKINKKWLIIAYANLDTLS